MTTQQLADRLGRWIEGEFFHDEQEADRFFAEVHASLSELAWLETTRIPAEAETW